MAYGTVKVDNITFDNGGSDQNVTVSGLYRATTSGVTVSGTITANTVSGITATFTSGNFNNVISSAATMSGALIMANQQQVQFREAVGNGVNYIALQAPAVVSADQTITLPDETGTIVTTGDNGSVSSTMLATNLTISAAAGSASTPSIAFTGDLNTGIYSPGADQLAISTNGTQKIFVGSGGNVGIDTSSPVDFGSGYRTFEVKGTTGGGVFRSTGDVATVDLYAESAAGGIGVLRTLGAHPLTFHTNSTERMRIDSSGNVGIGTSSPAVDLDVANADTTQLRIQATTNGVDTRVTSIGLTANAGIIGTYSNHPLVVYSNGTERIRIDSSGNINFSNAGLKLTAGRNISATTANSSVNIFGGDITTNIGANIELYGGSHESLANLMVFDAGEHRFRSTNAESEWMRITSAGNVGIGTGTPSRTLEVSTNTAGDFAAVAVNGNATGHALAGVCNSDNTSGRFFVGYSNSAAADRIIIYSNGNIQNTNNSYGQISDIKLKENIVDANSQWDDIKAIRVRNFNFKNGPNHSQIGVIAQEIEETSPGLVYETPDRDEDGNETGEVTKGVSYSVLYMKAVKALQEAIARIETLEAAVAALQGA